MSKRSVAPDLSKRELAALFDLSGRVAVVKGGSRGIGLAIAARLAEAGAHVVLADIATDRAAEAAQMLIDQGRSASSATLDVCSSESANACFRQIANDQGAVDILVNNAGLLPQAPEVRYMEDALWAHVFDVNVTGVMRCSRAAAQFLIASQFGGAIVNLNSTSGFRVSGAGIAPYASSKHAVGGLTKALAAELGPLGVRVNSVAPTLVASPGIQELFAESTDPDEALANAARYGETLPLGRIAVEDDIARGALFLASDMAALITGETLVIDGGALACGR